VPYSCCYVRYDLFALFSRSSRSTSSLMESESRSPVREMGQGLVEYSLILVLVAMTAVAILTILGPQIGNTFSTITSGLSPLPGP